MKKKEYTREELIAICERAFVPQEHWWDRDTAGAQIKMGSCLALLKAGCYFEIQYTKDGSGCSTDENTIWIQFWVHDFIWFETEHTERDEKGNKFHDYHFYLPTESRLDERKGMDWY